LRRKIKIRVDGIDDDSLFVLLPYRAVSLSDSVFKITDIPEPLLPGQIGPGPEKKPGFSRYLLISPQEGLTDFSRILLQHG